MKKYLLLCILVPLLASCGATVAVDYDVSQDFTGYKTYDFYPSIDSGLSQLDEKRIEKAVDSVLRLNGFRKSPDPDFWINYYGQEAMAPVRSTIGIGVGTGGSNGSVGVSGGIPVGTDEIEQRLTFDLVDAQADELIWQAVLEGRFKEYASPTQKRNYYLRGIQKVFSKFPPNG